MLELLDKKRSIKYLVLSITNRCNLNCLYCHMGNTGNTDMSNDVIDGALDLIDKDKKCHVQITGGEPSLNLSALRYVGERIRKDFTYLTIGVQTNATLISSEFIDIVKEFDMQVGVSLDGRKEINDLIRGKSKPVFGGMSALQRNGIEFRTTTVVSNINVEYLHEIPFILSAFDNSRGMALDMLVRKGKTLENNIFPPKRDVLEKSLMKLVENIEFVNRVRKIPLQLREINKLCEFKNSTSYCHGERGESVALSPTGELYPCGQVIGDRLFYMGHIKDSGKDNIPLDSSGIIYTYKNLQDSHPHRWDCPSRKYYNRSMEDWPDIHKILNKILYGGEMESDQVRRTI